MEISKEQVDRLLELLLEGYSVAETSRRLNIPQSAAYTIAKKNGWNRSMRKKSVCRNTSYDCPRKATMSVQEILEHYDNGESQTSIAKQAGVSRQRIQQIVTEHGRLGQSQKIALRKQQNAPKVALIKTLKQLIKAKTKEQTQEKRYQRHFEMFKEARIWWEQDVEIHEIARRLDMKIGSLNWYIGKFRKQYGWFPKREMFGHHRSRKVLSEEEKQARIFDKYKEIIPFWKQGASHTAIAKVLGWSKSKVAWGVHYLRKIGVDLPRRDGK